MVCLTSRDYSSSYCFKEEVVYDPVTTSVVFLVSSVVFHHDALFY